MPGLLSRLNEVFQEVFNDDALAVTRETTARDVDGWDSLVHVTLILAVEKRFGVRFTSSEVAALNNVGALADMINSKGATHR